MNKYEYRISSSGSTAVMHFIEVRLFHPDIGDYVWSTVPGTSFYERGRVEGIFGLINNQNNCDPFLRTVCETGTLNNYDNVITPYRITRLLDGHRPCVETLRYSDAARQSVWKKEFGDFDEKCFQSSLSNFLSWAK
jgi:hypothetical protein